MSKLMELTVEGRKFELNVAKAKAVGALKPVIEDIEIGDVFGKDELRIVVLRNYLNQWFITGCNDDLLQPFSNEQGVTKAQIIEYLQRRGYVKIGKLKVEVELF